MYYCLKGLHKNQVQIYCRHLGKFKTLIKISTTLLLLRHSHLMQVHWFNGSVVKTTTRCVTQPQSILVKITRYLFAEIIAKNVVRLPCRHCGGYEELFFRVFNKSHDCISLATRVGDCSNQKRSCILFWIFMQAFTILGLKDWDSNA